MANLHMQYYEIMRMDTFLLRGIIEAFISAKKGTQNTPINTGENTGEINDDDYDTSMWFT